MAAMQSIEDSWNEIETQTKAIYSAAKKGDWGTVLSLSSQRQQLLETHFKAHPIGPESAGFYRIRLSTLLDGEKTLSEFVRDARRSLMAEGAAMTHNHRAVGAYLHSSAV